MTGRFLYHRPQRRAVAAARPAADGIARPPLPEESAIRTPALLLQEICRHCCGLLALGSQHIGGLPPGLTASYRLAGAILFGIEARRPRSPRCVVEPPTACTWCTWRFPSSIQDIRILRKCQMTSVTLPCLPMRRRSCSALVMRNSAPLSMDPSLGKGRHHGQDRSRAGSGAGLPAGRRTRAYPISRTAAWKNVR